MARRTPGVASPAHPGAAGSHTRGAGCKGAEAGWGVLLREGPRVQVWERALQGGRRELTFVRLVE